MAGRATIVEIDEARRQGKLSWEDYAAMLQNHPDIGTFFNEFRPFAKSGRDRHGRLRELEDLGDFRP
jgi:hypothetical protein